MYFSTNAKTMLVRALLIVATIAAASNAKPQEAADVISPRCSKTMKQMYQLSGDGETYLGDYSWMVALGYQSKEGGNLVFRCGAMLITDQWVLTAAQCVTGTGNYELTKVRIGDLNLNPSRYDGVNPIEAVIDSIKIHPEYKVDSLANDIALIRLKTPADDPTGRIHPICLLSSTEFMKDENIKNKIGFILGFGVFKVGGGLSQKLLEGTVNTVDKTKCIEKYQELKSKSDSVPSQYVNLNITDAIICAGDTDQSACDGDTGGPIIYIDPATNRHYLGGIISGIYRCGIGYPNLFTKVAAYTSWINEVTGENFS